LLFNANSAIFQLYHGKNKLISNEVMSGILTLYHHIPDKGLLHPDTVRYVLHLPDPLLLTPVGKGNTVKPV
jgi:hypothetical protein